MSQNKNQCNAEAETNNVCSSQNTAGILPEESDVEFDDPKSVPQAGPLLRRWFARPMSLDARPKP